MYQVVGHADNLARLAFTATPMHTDADVMPWLMGITISATAPPPAAGPGAGKIARVDADDGSDATSAGGELTLRPAVPADAEKMSQVAQAAYLPYVRRIGRPPAPITADYVGIARGGRAWVAERHGRLAGFLVLESHPDHLLLENVAVHPDQQGTGVGGRLLALAEDQARLLGLPEVRLFTNAAMTENLEFYPRRGYRQTHRAEQDGYRRVFFSKHLPAD